MTAWLIAALALAADPVVLDNGAVRVEVDPQLFSIRFVGFPGGRNFLQAFHVRDALRDSGGLAHPGGLETRLTPHDRPDAALLRGPAEVIEQTQHSVAMLGPVSEALDLRLKKEVWIHPRQAQAWLTVTVLARRDEGRSWALSNVAHLPPSCALRLDRADGTLEVLEGAEDLAAAAALTERYATISIPPVEPLGRIVLGAFASKVAHVTAEGVWVRHIEDAPRSPRLLPDGVSFVALLDSGDGHYTAALRGPLSATAPAQPLVFRERWALQKRSQDVRDRP